MGVDPWSPWSVCTQHVQNGDPLRRDGFYQRRTRSCRVDCGGFPLYQQNLCVLNIETKMFQPRGNDNLILHGALWHTFYKPISMTVCAVACPGIRKGGGAKI